MFALTWQRSSHETHTQSDSTLQNDSVGLEKNERTKHNGGQFFSFLKKNVVFQSVRSKLGRLEIFFFSIRFRLWNVQPVSAHRLARHRDGGVGG